MTREIKFRAWDKEVNKMMFPVEFQSGIGVSIPNYYLNHEDSDMFLRCRFDTELMQYTGLKDKKGIEIYDGDVVSSWTDDTKFYGCGEVIMFKYSWCFRWIDDKEAHIQPFLEADVETLTLKIVGNIYENPELMEEK